MLAHKGDITGSSIHKLNMELKEANWQELYSDENPCTCTLNDTFIAIIASLTDKCIPPR